MHLRKIHSGDGLWDLFSNNKHLFFRQTFEYKNTTYFYKSNGISKSRISESEFLEEKFGRNYVPILEEIKHDDAISRWHNGRQYLCSYKSNIIWIFDKNGKLINTYKLEENIDSVYAFEIETENLFWFAHPAVDYVAQFSIQEFSEIKKIGVPYSSQSELNMPEDLIIYGRHLYISDTGNKRLLIYNLNSDSISKSIYFEETIWQFLFLKEEAIILLGNGIFAFDPKEIELPLFDHSTGKN